MTREILKVIAGTLDRPLILGDIEIPCYVLEDETRVITQTGLLDAIKRRVKTKKNKSSNPDELPSFLAPNNLKPFISEDLSTMTNPIKFQLPTNSTAHGFNALILPEICQTYLGSRQAGKLLRSQAKIAAQCEILILCFASMGIIALIDEVTGYQEIRAKNALAKILEEFIAKELQPWTKTFPLDFYQEIYRLKGWSFPELANGKKPKTPQVIGKYTNEIVYERLPHGVLKELQKVNPVIPGRGRENRHLQWFTPDMGHPKLKEHLAAVKAIMRLSSNWRIFKGNLQRSFPLRGDQLPINGYE